MCVVHTIANGLVLAALADGQVLVFNLARKLRFFIRPDKTCSKLTGSHSEIVAMCSLSSPPFILMGFSCGKIHVYSWSNGAEDSLKSSEGHHCTHLPHNQGSLSLQSLLCFHSHSSSSGGDVLSVWCGTTASSLVVLEYPLTPATLWGLCHDTQRVSSTVQLRSDGPEFTAKELRLSHDELFVLTLLHQPGSQSSTIAIVDTSSKTPLLLVASDISGRLSVSAVYSGI